MNALEKYLSNRKGREIEKQLAGFLTLLRADLLLGSSIESALENSGKQLKKPLKGEIRFIVKECEKGADVREALRNAALKTGSMQFRKVLSHLNSIASTGYSKETDTLRLLSKEIIQARKNKIKEFSARLAVLSLFFIAVTVIAPALWLAFAGMGSAFFSTPITAEQVWITTIIGFPAASATVLLYIKESWP